MVATNIDGERVAEVTNTNLAAEIQRFPSSAPPGLATVLVGTNVLSKQYLEKKKEACEEVGIDYFSLEFPVTISQDELTTEIVQLNNRQDVHGIWIQLPLPKSLDEQAVFEALDPEKDVQGMHPLNVSKLVSTHLHNIGDFRVDWKHLDSIPFNIPCAALACVALLDLYNVKIQGSKAVVIGRSNLVGTPIARLLMHRNATVTIVHSKTRQPERIVKTADIVVAAVGRANFVQETWLKRGCVILDVGLNRVPDTFAGSGYVLTGDVDHEGARRVASQISLVPGGVGPMTLAMMLRNTVNSYKRQKIVDLRASF